MISDPYAVLRDRVLHRVIEGPGVCEPDIRRAAAAGTAVQPALQPLIDKIHAHAYRVTDADVAALQSAYGDDGAFEIIVSAALGASRKRLLAGLRALEQA